MKKHKHCFECDLEQRIVELEDELAHKDRVIERMKRFVPTSSTICEVCAARDLCDLDDFDADECTKFKIAWAEAWPTD